MKSFFSSVTSVFSFLAKIFSFFRNTILNIFFVFLVLVLVLSLLPTSKEATIRNKSALVLSIVGDIVEEKKGTGPFSELLSETTSLKELPRETSFQGILDAIHTAAHDSRISCIVLDLDKMGNAGLNQLQVIGKALRKFKQSGKRVIAAEDYFTQKKYYLASYADKIILNPMGAVDLHGFGVYRLYFKDILDKLAIKVHVFRVGKYKSAVEPFIGNQMSPEVKSQNRQWLSSLWTTFTTDVCRNRSLSLHAVDDYINNISENLSQAKGDTAVLAKKTGLVDELKTRDQTRDYLVHMTAPDQESDFRQVSLKDYLKTIAPSYVEKGKSKNQIGIIVAEGTMFNGNRPIGSIGGDSLAALIRKAQNDDRIKAVVLRINSGGGSVFASEVIRQALLSLKRSGKPYVVSMGSMAASGAYWISADANEIWASPVTLTGSIGIFGAIPTFEGTLDKFGIHSDGIGTSKLASGLNLTQPFSPMLAKTVQLSLDRGYDKFLHIVERGRKISPDAMNAIAQGRVFDGLKAQKLGLVDKIGTLHDAVAAAAGIAGVKEYSGVVLHKPLSLENRLLQTLGGKIIACLQPFNLSSKFLSSLAELTKPFDDVFTFNDPKGMYALWALAFHP